MSATSDAVLSGVVSGVASGIVTSVVAAKILVRRQLGSTSGDASPVPMSNEGDAIAAVGNTSVGDMVMHDQTKIDVRHGPGAEPRLLAQLIEGRVFVENVGALEAFEAEWHVDGDRKGVNMYPSGGRLPDPMSAGARKQVASVKRTINADPDGEMYVVVTWAGVGGERQEFTLPI